MKLPKSLTTVTPLSKTIAAVLFITFPFVGFLAGMEYEKLTSPKSSDEVTRPTSFPTPFISELPAETPVTSGIPTQTPSRTQNPEEGVVCTQDAKMCPDGSYVSRQGPR